MEKFTSFQRNCFTVKFKDMDKEIAYIKWLKRFKRTRLIPLTREHNGGILRNKYERKDKIAFNKCLNGLEWFKNNEYE